METTKVTENIYQVSGGVGNAFFYTAPNEVILIDGTINEESATGLIAEIKKISQQPVKTILLTHSDGDHINGLATIVNGQTIISHPNSRGDIEKANTGADIKQPLPNLTFTDHLTLYAGNEIIHLYYFGPAHTSGDVVVHFQKEKLVIVGDLVFIGRDPLVHQHKNGNSHGLVKVLKKIKELDADYFLSGHGDPVGKDIIEKLITKLEDQQEQIKSLIRKGKTLKQIKEDLGVEDDPNRKRPSLTEVIFDELSKN
jgi:cyclase